MAVAIFFACASAFVWSGSFLPVNPAGLICEIEGPGLELGINLA
jgi:hypothetical protein